jgi:carbon monoxide dehydrogenase subunit G
MNKQEWLNLALSRMNSGQWFGWRKEDDNGNVIPNDQRMTYANIKIIKDGATIPSEADVNAKIQEIKDGETKKINDKASANAKLKALGLTDDEIEALK